MQHYQQTALDYARANSLPKLPESMEYLNGVCKRHGVRPVELIARMLQRPVTLNFHPDRISSDGRTVLESMTAQGYYHCQFLTGYDQRQPHRVSRRRTLRMGTATVWRRHTPSRRATDPSTVRLMFCLMPMERRCGLVHVL